MDIKRFTATASNFPKDYILLFLGAIISIATTLVINNVNNGYEEKKEARKERIQFADSLMRGLAKRFTYTAEYYNAKVDTNHADEQRWQKLDDDLDVYLASNVYYNYSRLRILFSDTLATDFKNSIDDPFDKYKSYIDTTSGPQLKLEYNKITQWQEHLDTVNHRFAMLLYRNAFN